MAGTSCLPRWRRAWTKGTKSPCTSAPPPLPWVYSHGAARCIGGQVWDPVRVFGLGVLILDVRYLNGPEGACFCLVNPQGANWKMRSCERTWIEHGCCTCCWSVIQQNWWFEQLDFPFRCGWPLEGENKLSQVMSLAFSLNSHVLSGKPSSLKVSTRTHSWLFHSKNMTFPRCKGNLASFEGTLVSLSWKWHPCCMLEIFLFFWGAPRQNWCNFN